MKAAYIVLWIATVSTLKPLNPLVSYTTGHMPENAIYFNKYTAH